MSKVQDIPSFWLLHRFSSSDYAQNLNGFGLTAIPPGVPADLKSAVKKVRPIKTGGFVIPQQKEKHTPLLRIANPQSLNRLGHFLTPDCKSGETPSGNKELVIPCLEYGVLVDFPTCESSVLYFSGIISKISAEPSS